MPRMRPASSTEMVRDLVTGMPVEFSFMVTGSGSDTLTFFETDGPGFMALDDVSLTAATPLPAALPLFATGLGGLGLLGWRRKRKAQAV
jgi:hypothetical protein